MKTNKTKKKHGFKKIVHDYDLLDGSEQTEAFNRANEVYDSKGKCLKNRFGKRKDLIIKKSVEEFAKTYQPFIKACEKAGIESSKNEASKYRRGFGTAIKFSNEQWRTLPHRGNDN